MFLQNEKGFSLIELLTTVSIVGTLAIVGIRSQQTQVNKAKSAEAKHSLSYLYSAEEIFKSKWSTYHENLVVVGAIPSGVYHYDVGFGDIEQPKVKKDEGSLGDHAFSSTLNIVECTNFYRICLPAGNTGSCLAKLKTAATTTYSTYFSRIKKCEIKGKLYSAGSTKTAENVTLPSSVTQASLDAKGTGNDATFKAIATAKLKGNDIWSIDHNQTLTHVEDGT